jgi:hypothetical protein
MFRRQRVDLTNLDEAFATGPASERTSDVRLCGDQDDTSGLDLARRAEEAEPSERATIPPARTTLQPPACVGVGSIDEVLFRFACGDYDGALAASEALMSRIPVVIMPRPELRAEPLGYWHLLLLTRIDDETSLSDLLADVPAADAVRLVCELVERRIIALR